MKCAVSSVVMANILTKMELDKSMEKIDFKLFNVPVRMYALFQQKTSRKIMKIVDLIESWYILANDYFILRPKYQSSSYCIYVESGSHSYS